MATEEPNKIDDLLKRYAKERREQGGDFALHEATRRMLQGEVARQFRARAPDKEATGGFISWLVLWRGRLALGGAVAAAVVLGVVMLGPNRKPEMQLARNLQRDDNLKREDESRTKGLASLSADKEGDGLAAAKPAEPTMEKRKAVESEALLAEVDAVKLNVAKKAEVAQASGSLQPVQTAPANAVTFQLQNDAYTPVLAQKERFLSLTPNTNALRFGTATVAESAPEARGFASYSIANYNEAAGQGLGFGGRSTNAFAFSGVASPPPPALGVAPQLAYGIDAPATRPLESLGDLQPRPNLAKTFPEASGGPGTRARGGAGGVAMNAPASAPAPAQATAPLVVSEVVGTDAKSSAKSVAEKDRSAAALGGAALPAERKGEAMVFLRESALGRQSGEAVRRLDDVRMQREEAVDKLATVPQVLSRFTVEFSEDTIRLTDEDKSVYEGTLADAEILEEAPVSDPARRENITRNGREVLLRSAAPTAGPQPRYSFRAVGSNVTLRQPVVLNGRLSGATAVSSSDRRGGAQPGGLAPATPAPAGAPMAMRRFAITVPPTNVALTIEGTVKVGSTNEQRFRAIRAPR